VKSEPAFILHPFCPVLGFLRFNIGFGCLHDLDLRAEYQYSQNTVSMLHDNRAISSAWLERLLDTQEVTCSVRYRPFNGCDATAFTPRSLLKGRR